MFGLTKKRFLITLGLSVMVWVFSVVFQALIEAPRYIAFFTQSSCSATGYPITQCIKGTPDFFIYLINVLFWFFIIHLFWGWFEKRKSSG